MFTKGLWEQSTQGRYSQLLLEDYDVPSKLSQSILSCTECNKLEDSVAETVRPFVKPCAHFDIYTNWKPVPVKLAFIAEAPPGNSEGYFYDPLPHVNYMETLRASLFDLLELRGETTSARLAQFKERGYFLLDAIKCRCRKKNGQPPELVTRTCGEKWLMSELTELDFPKRICVLGKAAKLALSQLKAFYELSVHSVTTDCGRIVQTDMGQVLIWPFPSWRNEKYYKSKIDDFKRFCYVQPGKEQA